METLAAKISALEAEILSYKKDYDDPNSSEVKKEKLLDTISESKRTLNRFLDQQSAGKFRHRFSRIFNSVQTIIRLSMFDYYHVVDDPLLSTFLNFMIFLISFPFRFGCDSNKTNYSKGS